MDSTKVLIYYDEGVDLRSLQQTLKSFEHINIYPKLIDRHVLSTNSRLEARLFVMPGGQDLPYQAALKGDSNRKIREYVENGGAYLGICAGAYYGSDSIEFEKNGPLEVTGKRELGFFPGMASGPAYGNGQFDYRNDRGALIANLQGSNNQTYKSYYNGGCCFKNAELFPSIKILATYADIECQPAAIVECLVGKGKAILTGVHPEFSACFLKPSQDLYTQKLISKLKDIEQERKELFTHLLDRLSIQSG